MTLGAAEIPHPPSPPHDAPPGTAGLQTGTAHRPAYGWLHYQNVFPGDASPTQTHDDRLHPPSQGAATPSSSDGPTQLQSSPSNPPTVPLASTPTPDRDAIRKAYEIGTLIDYVAGTSHDQIGCVSKILSELHNKGEVNFLQACGSQMLNALSRRSFPQFRRVFLQTFPNINCSTTNAISTCKQVSTNLPENETSGFAYDALRDWLQKSRTRIDDSLALMRNNTYLHGDVVRSVLLAYAKFDAPTATVHGLDLCVHADPDVRLSAVKTMGHLVPSTDRRLIRRVLERIMEIVSGDASDEERSASVDTALHVYQRTSNDFHKEVNSILKAACEKSTPLLRHTLVFALPSQRDEFSAEIVATMLSALEKTTADEANTVDMLDAVLYHWDPHAHRCELFRFFGRLLTLDDRPVDLSQFDVWQHKLRSGRGSVRGWYIVSFLLTGDRSLGRAATILLQDDKAETGIETDLRPFSLKASQILFLARKILGYCISSKNGSADLLLSCLRAVPKEKRQTLEELIFDHFLMNYWTGITRLKAALGPNDECGASVNRLASRLDNYLDQLRRPGVCVEFRPSDRERRIQYEFIQDTMREGAREAEEKSKIDLFAQKLTLLYGTKTVLYHYTDASSKPIRQELAMSHYKNSVEMPRLSVLDPVGWAYTSYRFRSEPPPQ